MASITKVVIRAAPRPVLRVSVTTGATPSRYAEVLGHIDDDARHIALGTAPDLALVYRSAKA